MGLHILVLAGGSGTRLWPLSRNAVPKHLLPLNADGSSLLRATVLRVQGLGAQVHIVTAAAQAELCRAAVADLDLGDTPVIVEPEPRGTGPALGLATRWIADSDPDALICSVHADHHVGDVAAYRAAVYAAAGWALASGGLATVGIRPSYPATGFGYIEVGESRAVDDWRDPGAPPENSDLAGQAIELEAHRSLGFREKPDQATATAFVDGGRHLWNLGLFAWTAKTFLSELSSADPLLAAGLGAVVAARRGGDEAAAGQTYAALRGVAIEPLLFEHTPQLTVVTATFAWSDLGSWNDLAAARRDQNLADMSGNVVEGDAVLLDSVDCLVASRGGRLVAVVGAANLIVVDTGDAVLVVPADRAQEVKDLVDRLRGAGRDQLV